MSNALTLQTMEDGPKNAIIKVNVVDDTSDTAETVVADPATLVATFPPTNQLRLDEIQYDVKDGWFVTLMWKATTSKVIATLSGRGMFRLGLNFGGLQNNSTTGKTGQISLKTTGYTSGTMTATIVLACAKQTV